MSKRNLSEFEKAFAKARKAGAEDFDYYGKKYHTRMKGETPDDWRAKMKSVSAKPIVKPLKAPEIKAEKLEEPRFVRISPSEVRGKVRRMWEE